MAAERLSTRCCIVGGGPCGLMLGFLLARAGVDVVVLEKHADFLRDFRGDTIHPSTLEVMHELGLLDDVPQAAAPEGVHASARSSATDEYAFADFSHLPTRCKFIALMPQWDFLDFLAEQGKRYPTFHLRMRAEAVDLIEEGGRVAGVRANTPDGRARDPRRSRRSAATAATRPCASAPGFAVEELGAPMDVLWFRLPKQARRPRRDHGPRSRPAASSC